MILTKRTKCAACLASRAIKDYAVQMNDFRKPHGNGGNRGGNDRFGRKDFGRPSFGNRGGGFSRPGSGGDFRPTEMHQAVCSKCGRTCEVPFRPNGKKPVYCKECFESTTRDTPPQNFERRGFNTPPPSRPQNNEERPFQPIRDTRIDDLKRQADAMQSKLDRILQIMESMSRPKSPVAMPQEIAQPEGGEKKAVAPKKSAAKKKKA